MTKGRFALLTAALGLATMAGTGYLAYASSSPHPAGSGSGPGASGANAAAGAPGSGQGGGVVLPPGAATAAGGDGGSDATVSGKSAPACGNEDVRVSQTDLEGAAGHVSLLLTFTDVGDHACELHGYPGAELLGPGGMRLMDAKRTLAGPSGGAVGLASPPPVVLAPGAKASASAVVEWSDVPTGSGADGGCAASDAVSLAVTPPNTTQTTTLSLGQTQACGEFQIHPVLRGVTRTPSGG